MVGQIRYTVVLSVVTIIMSNFRFFVLLLIYCLPASFAEAQSQDEMEDLRRRADQLQQSARYGEALPLVEQLSEAVRKNFGDKLRRVRSDYRAASRSAAGARPLPGSGDLFKHALEIATTALGPEHAGVTFVLNDSGAPLQSARPLQGCGAPLPKGAWPSARRLLDLITPPSHTSAATWRRCISPRADTASRAAVRDRHRRPRESPEARPSRSRQEPQQPRDALLGSGPLHRGRAALQAGPRHH